MPRNELVELINVAAGMEGVQGECDRLGQPYLG
jgi:hypothetical protein